MATKSLNTRIEKFLQEYTSLLGINIAFTVDEDDGIVKITLQTDGDVAGLLIGAKGRNVYAFQRLINIVFNAELGEKKIVVNVDDWLEKEEARLNDLAQKTAQHVLQTGQPQNLYNLSPAQRRIVHTALANFDGIKTLSEGEGVERFLVVSPK